MHLVRSAIVGCVTGGANARFIGMAAIFVGLCLLGVGAAGYLWGVRNARSAYPIPTADEAPKALQKKQRLSQETDRVHANDDIPANTSSTTQQLDESSPSSEEGRDRAVERLKSSGPDRRNLVVDARRVGRDWAEAAKAKGLDVTFDDWECHRAGCLVNARHGSAAIVDQVTDEITRSGGFMSWNGGKFRSGPIASEGGKTEVTWVLFAPPDDAKALQEIGN